MLAYRVEVHFVRFLVSLDALKLAQACKRHFDFAHLIFRLFLPYVSSSTFSSLSLPLFSLSRFSSGTLDLFSRTFRRFPSLIDGGAAEPGQHVLS